MLLLKTQSLLEQVTFTIVMKTKSNHTLLSGDQTKTGNGTEGLLLLMEPSTTLVLFSQSL